MKSFPKLYIAMAAAGLCSSAFAADDVEELKRELRELRSKTEQLEKKVEHLESERRTAAPTSTTTDTIPGAAATARDHADHDHDHSSHGVRERSLLHGPSGSLNLSLHGLVTAGSSTARDVERLNIGAHDPSSRGFTLQALELLADGAIDPYFRAFAAIDFHLDAGGETGIELEEAYIESLSLPWELTLRAGQFYTDFGRHNPIHPHAWAFIDAPLVNSRLLGPEGLRNPGARLSWHAPFPVHTDLSFSLQNSQGGTADSFRNDHEGDPFLGRPHNQTEVHALNDLIFTPRLVSTFDITALQTASAGLSAAFGPNASGTDTRTQIYGADFLWKWKSSTDHNAYPFVFWQTEAMLRRYQAGAFSEDFDMNGTLDPGEPDLDGDGLLDILPAERLTDYGFYTQIGYGFYEGWVAGLRFDYVTTENRAAYEDPLLYGRDFDRGERWRISPNLTWRPSDFAQIRLQYNYDDRRFIGQDHSVWLQLKFQLGSHGPHTH